MKCFGSEEPISLAECARSWPPSGVSVSTINRWWLRGVGGIRLTTWKIAGRRYTTREAAERFAMATTAAANGEQFAAVTPRQRQQAIRQAEADLDDAGI